MESKVKIAIGNEFPFSIAVYRINDTAVVLDSVSADAVPEDLSQASNVFITLSTLMGAKFIVPGVINANVITCEVPVMIQRVSKYFATLDYDLPDPRFVSQKRHVRGIYKDVFDIVESEADANVDGNVGISASINAVVKAGLDGLDAWQIAVNHGYTGTYEEYALAILNAIAAGDNEILRVQAETNRTTTFEQQASEMSAAKQAAITATNAANLAAQNALDAKAAADAATQAAIDSKSSADAATANAITATEEATAAANDAKTSKEAADLAAQTALSAKAAAEAATQAAITATTAAEEATTNANNAIASALTAIQNAEHATVIANTSANNADEATDAAILAANNAIDAKNVALQATQSAVAAATSATDAAALANTAATNANNAASAANTAATTATTAAGNANAAATAATNATATANTAAGNANAAATAATNATATANTAASNANGQAGTYNVTVAVPLAAGNYYTNTTARAAVPTGVRLLGRTITYATASGVWYTEKYIGTDVANWTTSANWERVPDNSQLIQIGADLSSALKCNITTIDEYLAISQPDIKTLYVITAINEATGKLEISAAYLGDLKFATGGGTDVTGIPIEVIQLSEYDVTIERGATKLITASWQPTDATNTVLSWVSSNTLVASVNTGTITGNSKGTAVITVKARSGVNDTVNVTVVVTLTSLSLTADKTVIVPSSSTDVIAIPTPSDADIDLTWSSSNAESVSVIESGTDTKKATVNSGIIGKGTLVVNSGATTNGFIFVKPNEVFEVPVTAGMTAIQIADLIRSTSFNGWTTGGTVGTDTIEFTKNSVGLCYNPSLKDAVTAAEVDTLTIKTIPTVNGNITISLDGVDYVLSLNTATHTTRPIIASAIAAMTFAGWTVTASNNVVTFTQASTGRRITPVFTDSGVTGCTAAFKQLTKGDTSTGVTGTFVSHDTSSVTITAVDVKGKSASLNFNIEPYSILVDSPSIDKTDNSVTSIFTNWTIDRTGTVSRYKFKETYVKAGTTYTLQETDFAQIPDNNIIQIELYAEFGNKKISWTFKDTGGKEESIEVDILYKEPELIHYSFDIDVTCTPEEAYAMTMEVPFYKYDKKFAYNLRNDDTKPSIWRTAFRFVNREWNSKIIPFVPYQQNYIDSATPDLIQKSPRRLGYTDGTGIIKTFVFDTAGMVIEGEGTEANPAIILWDRVGYTGDRVDLVDTLKLKDYGGHFLIHNMALLPTDSQYYTPKYPNDYTYALQRDRQIIYDRLGYTSVHFANPDGSWWYTRPVIKDPKTLLMSGGGTCYDIDPNDVYGKPAFRSTYGYQSDLSNVPLSEIRNTLLVGYIFNNNAPSTGNNWKVQYVQANNGLPSFAVELTHGIGYAESLPFNSFLESNLNFFNEIYDVVGANGNDWIWFCSGDEVIEYMYYQRVVQITKTITGTGCKFNISFDIPDYLSYKTYSVKIKNLPTNANVSMNTSETLTYYSKNMNTGLINWGVSSDISERANRYLANYKANPTNDNLDKAWYFVRQMGEIGAPLTAQLPALNEKPVISSITYNATPTDSKIDIVTINSNKEFGEADYLDVSTDETFASFTTYQIPYTGHKYYDSLDATSKNYTFNIDVSPNFGVFNTYYARLRNFYGNSNTYSMNITLTRTSGVNDPVIEFVQPEKFTSDTEVTFTITHSYISAMRYKLTDTFTDWVTPTESITIPMNKGTTYTLVAQGKNNLDEIVEKIYTINFTGKQQIIVFGNVSNEPTYINGVGYVNKTARPGTTNRTIKDLEGNIFCTEQGQYYNNFKTAIDTLRTYWGVIDGAELGSAYWQVPSLITEGGDYPNSIIYNGTNRNVLSYGGVRPDQTYQAVKYLTGVPQGTYKVKLLVSTKGIGESNTTNPIILRVNNTTQKITDTRIFCNNNTVWQTFYNINVDSSGYMLISQYSDVMFTSSIGGLPPIVLIEITKIG